MSKFKQQNRNKERQDDHRSAKNQVYVRETDLNLDLKYLSTKYSDFNISFRDCTVLIPITTRGIGINLISHWTHMMAQGVRDPRVSIYQVYRLSLAQLEYKIFKSRPSVLPQDGVLHERSMRLALPFDRIIKSMTSNFGIIADLVNSVGIIVSDGQHFAPTIHTAQRLEVANKKRSHSLKSSAPNFIRPDPYTITFSNLAEVVEAMSSIDVPVDIRRAFIACNPMPGAIYEDDLLTNPNDFWVDGYSDATMAREILEVNAFLASVEAKKRSWVKQVTYSEGSEAMLVTTSKIVSDDVFRADVSGQNEVVEPSNLRFTNIHRIINQAASACGVIILAGEYPDIPYRHGEFYSIRNFVNHCSACHAYHAGLVNVLLAD